MCGCPSLYLISYLENGELTEPIQEGHFEDEVDGVRGRMVPDAWRSPCVTVVSETHKRENQPVNQHQRHLAYQPT